MKNALFAGNLSGGGLQVATSYINDLLENPENSNVIFTSLIIHNNIFKNLSLDKQKKANDYFELKIINNRNNLLNIKQQLFLNKFKIVFCIFGPLYSIPFLKKFTLVSGFARPDMIFKEIYQYKGLIEKLKILFSKVIFKLNTDFYIVETDLVKERLRNFFNLRNKVIYVVHNSISTQIRDKQINMKIIPLDNKKELNIGFLGKHYKHKRIDILIKSLEHLSKNYNLNVKFLVTLQEKEFLNFLKKIKNKFKVKNLGYLKHEEIHKFYEAVDVCITCSELECFSAFPLESMFFYKPIICSDYSFHSEIYKNYAYYFKGGNYLSLCEKIIELKVMDSKKLETKLTAAHDFVISLPSAYERTSQYNKIISKISKNK